jgi:hypothetical protein
MTKKTSLSRDEGIVNSDLREAVVDLAKRLGVGQFAAQLCPDCQGGPSKERSLSIEVGQNGIIRFYCHRGTCGFNGNAYLSPAAHNLGVIQNSPVVVSKQRPLTDSLHPLSEREVAFFLGRYGIPERTLKDRVYRTETRYALSILRPNGTRRGFITRRPYEGSPADTAANRNDPQWSTKALTYLEGDDEPCLSWYGSPDLTVVLVEDQLSAMRLSSFYEHLSVCALLGTSLNAAKVREIAAQRPTRVWIALDADATGQAFAMARKWNPGFDSLRVCVLSKDIKDMSDDEINRLPI